MYEIEIERTFCAAHAIVMNGEREPVHGHNWRVVATVRGERLDDDGLLCDFHDVDASLVDILAPFQNADLNATPPFDSVNPTAEHVARHIALSLAGGLPAGLNVASVAVTEAPGCRAIYRPAGRSPAR